jgi:hypothetical protein
MPEIDLDTATSNKNKYFWVVEKLTNAHPSNTYTNK